MTQNINQFFWIKTPRCYSHQKGTKEVIGWNLWKWTFLIFTQRMNFMRSMLHIASKTLIFCLNTDYHMVRNKLSGSFFCFFGVYAKDSSTGCGFIFLFIFTPTSGFMIQFDDQYVFRWVEMGGVKPTQKTRFHPPTTNHQLPTTIHQPPSTNHQGHSWRVCWVFLIFSSTPWPFWLGKVVDGVGT